MRTKVRAMYGIRGSILEDFCCISCCHFCTVLQMHRELRHLGHSHM
jgi:Cys-rich protein (TIGR01571 family)